jgi:hypothetical protein
VDAKVQLFLLSPNFFLNYFQEWTLSASFQFVIFFGLPVFRKNEKKIRFFENLFGE